MASLEKQELLRSVKKSINYTSPYLLTEEKKKEVLSIMQKNKRKMFLTQYECDVLWIHDKFVASAQLDDLERRWVDAERGRGWSKTTNKNLEYEMESRREEVHRMNGGGEEETSCSATYWPHIHDARRHTSPRVSCDGMVGWTQVRRRGRKRSANTKAKKPNDLVQVKLYHVTASLGPLAHSRIRQKHRNVFVYMSGVMRDRYQDEAWSEGRLRKHFLSLAGRFRKA